MSKSTNSTDLNLPIKEDLMKAVLLIRVLNHDLRREILEIIHVGECITYTDIYIRMKIEASVARAHLAMLHRADILLIEKQGVFEYYSIDYKFLNRVQLGIDLIFDQ